MGKVIAGDYMGYSIAGGEIVMGFRKKNCIPLNKETVEKYEWIGLKEEKESSGLLRGMVGEALLGTAGAIAGVNSAKTEDTHLLKVTFKDGKESIVQLTDWDYHIFMIDMQ